MIWKSLNFWTLLVGLIAYVVSFLVPNFPFTSAQMLSIVLFMLGLIGVYPQFKFMSATWQDLLANKEFWMLITGFVAFVVMYYFPQSGLDQGKLLAVVMAILAIFNIYPELRMRNLL